MNFTKQDVVNAITEVDRLIQSEESSFFDLYRLRDILNSCLWDVDD